VALRWVEEACARLLAPAPELVALAAWLGAATDDDTRVFVERPDAVDADFVLVLASAGAVTSLTAGYAAGAGPCVSETERALGRARELPRPATGPFQLAFPGPSSAAASCFIAGTTYDPPGLAAAERRLVELTLRRDPPR
jgi:hypothetical protein